jgi:hypothetical protein
VDSEIQPTNSQPATTSNVICDCLQLPPIELKTVVEIQKKEQHTQQSFMITSEVMLTTAIILVQDNMGNYQECRALLDSASQSHFITTNFARKLNINVETSHMQYVSSINGNHANIEGKIHTSIKSKNNKFKKNIECLVIEKITNSLPNQFYNVKNWNIPNNVVLADKNFNIPSGIDLLLGAEFFLELFHGATIQLGQNLPMLKKSVFGWVISGRVKPIQSFVSVNSDDCQLNQILRNFWELESVSSKQPLSQEELFCESHFIQNYKRLSNGKYEVSLPFRQNPQTLGHSRELALKRFTFLESRLAKNPEIKIQYQNFMSEYINLNHMIVGNEDDASGYYLPHHSIVKESSTTTKLRVVFDASAKTSNGTSLNDVLGSGPVVQQDLFSIVLRFRQYRYVMTADIEKMYRMILMSPADTIYQKIIWRSDSSKPIQTYELNTITYGTKSAPYLATRVLKQIAIDNEKSNPEAAGIITNDFYVDDLLTGFNNIEEAKLLQQQLIEILKSAGMKLRKWSSNEPELLQGISSNDREFDFNKMSVNETILQCHNGWKIN